MLWGIAVLLCLSISRPFFFSGLLKTFPVTDCPGVVDNYPVRVVRSNDHMAERAEVLFSGHTFLL